MTPDGSSGWPPIGVSPRSGSVRSWWVRGRRGTMTRGSGVRWYLRPVGRVSSGHGGGMAEFDDDRGSSTKRDRVARLVRVANLLKAHPEGTRAEDTRVRGSACERLAGAWPARLREHVGRSLDVLQRAARAPLFTDHVHALTKAWAERRVVEIEYEPARYEGRAADSRRATVRPYLIDPS